MLLYSCLDVKFRSTLGTGVSPEYCLYKVLGQLVFLDLIVLLFAVL